LFAISVVKTDVEALSTVDLVSKIAGGLRDPVVGVISFIVDLPFSRKFVTTLGLEPLFGPLSQITPLGWLGCIVSFLDRPNKVGQGRVGPTVAAEVNLETSSETLPADQENQLLDHRGTLAVGYAVNQRFGGVGAGAIRLDLVI
jgi:hypothetical protein